LCPIQTKPQPVNSQVRIFIKFDRVEAATRALVDLQGRFFGGRQVRCGARACCIRASCSASLTLVRLCENLGGVGWKLRAVLASCLAITPQVRAAFFSEDRFGKQQLAPQAGEFGDS
jgi:hypothetical protein